ncbi:MAG: hypothetical protein KKA73_21450 [Chloroflexi bacterium]|nr:hypothetical protein [Chloroflexota bacterium]MBU1750260.1 hypothetical protein [Chloroflexota bacterium]MBU1880278.1 hypothetical protein [Chloroflexota bacterium]
MSLLSGFGADVPVQVELFTSDHVARGTMSVPRGQRVTDVLNNPHESIVHLTNVQLDRLLLPYPQPLAAEALRVAKNTLLFAIPIDEPEPETIHDRTRKFVPKQRYDIIATVPGFEIRGALHLARGTKLRSIFDVISYAFVPITVPQISFMFDPRRQFDTNVVIVNKPRIQFFLTIAE